MKAIIKITKHGASLDLIITKEAKKMGLKYGDYVMVTLEPALISDEITKVPKSTTSAKITKDAVTNTETKPQNYFKENHDNPEKHDISENHDNFDPADMGEKVIKLMGDSAFSDAELVSLIKRYDGKQSHVQAILGYIKEKRNDI